MAIKKGLPAYRVDRDDNNLHPPPGKHTYVVPFPTKNRRSGNRSDNDQYFTVDERYDIKLALGAGTFGYVCLAEDTENGNEEVAIKKCWDVREETIIPLLREIKLLRQLKHPFIVTLKDMMHPANTTITRFDHVYMVYERVDTDLQQILLDHKHRRITINAEYRKLIMYQMLKGLEYMHSMDVLHRDLKPSNILVNFNSKRIKIADFGFARVKKAPIPDMTVSVFTKFYCPPELLLAQKLNLVSYDASADIWALGCIFAELLDGRFILFGCSDVDCHPTILLKNIATFIPVDKDPSSLDFIEDDTAKQFVKRFLPERPDTTLRQMFPWVRDGHAIDLLEKMLVFNPRKRINVSEALRHPYMADVNVDFVAPRLGLSIEEVNTLNDVNPRPITNINEEELEDFDEEDLRSLLWAEIDNFKVN